MRSYRDAKLMARTLRDMLGALRVEISHSKSLEIVAKQFGCDNWNVLAARISDHLKQGESPEFHPATPILRIFSVPKATEFYGDFLGFGVDWRTEGQGPVYMQVSRSSLTLHLREHYGDASPGSTAFVPMTNIDAYHAELRAKAYRYMNPGVERLPWGRTLEVIDPFSNRLRFCEPTSRDAEA